MARPEKVQEVQEIAGRFNASQSALLTEYRGLTVTEIAEVRNSLREADAEYKVLKNTLARLAVREVGLEELVGLLEGPTAVAFIRGDAVDAAKVLDDAAKRFPVLVVKGGVLDGRIIDAEQARGLARLEPREVQLAKIVMMVNTPLQQTANVLSALLRDFGSMLGQVLQQKESETPPEQAAPEESAPKEPAAEAEAPAVPEAEEQAAAAPEAEEAAPPEATAEEVAGQTNEEADEEPKEEES